MVKVGHRQVVNMIRQGGNTLMVKVVMVTRHPDMDEAVHKKGTYIFTALTLAVSWRAGLAHTEPWAPAPRLQEGTLWCPPAVLALGR